MVQNSSESALDESTYDHLLEVAEGLEPPFDAECTFVFVAGGRLGMRAGEICHMRENWIDWNRNVIEIPRYDPCDHGQGGAMCGYCQTRAKSAAEHDDDLSYEDALKQRWNPKTSNSARAVPFDFSEDVELTVEAFFSRYDRYEHSRASVNRRVDRVLEAAGLPKDTTFPHGLRATAASFHAYKGLPAPALQSMMGWADLLVAQKYLRLSGGATADALQEVHGD